MFPGIGLRLIRGPLALVCVDVLLEINSARALFFPGNVSSASGSY